ncbi:MAG TPA: hypothetical protein VMW45_02165 [Dehalococcoidia bacterium]|nr:hypothetical protein [Dehalococcoidia bacterium]
MSEAQYVAEVDVLIGVAKWLHSNGWQLEKVSPPRGLKDEEKMKAGFTAAGIPISNLEFGHVGEDIRARQGEELWKIECKCLSGGRPATDKNNFDRAVASAVSYYTQSKGLRLGLAVPEWYTKFIQKKLPRVLREAVNLWIFLYASKDEIYEFTPEEEIPS